MKMDSTSTDAILAALESGDNTAWPALVDLLEQQGDTLRAKGALWLAAKKKLPLFYPGAKYGWVVCHAPNDTSWFELPLEVFRKLPGWEPHCVRCRFKDFKWAILDAARAVGEAIEKGELQP